MTRELMGKNHYDLILVSGNTKRPTKLLGKEAENLSAKLRGAYHPQPQEGCVWQERSSNNTAQNLVCVAHLLQVTQQSVATMEVVTNAFHEERVRLLVQLLRQHDAELWPWRTQVHTADTPKVVEWMVYDEAIHLKHAHADMREALRQARGGHCHLSTAKCST